MLQSMWTSLKNIEIVALLYVNIVTLGCTWKFSCMPKLQNIFFQFRHSYAGQYWYFFLEWRALQVSLHAPPHVSTRNTTPCISWQQKFS